MMATAERTWRKKKTIQELASLLRDSGEKILNGQSKLSLSTGCLSMLNEGFRAIRDEETGNVTFDVTSNTHRQPEVISLQFLYDFVQKTKAFKLTHSNETIQGHVSIAAFRALRSLDLRKIPLHLLRGLQQLRPRLVAVACSRCLRNIQELFETCGGDMSSAMSWPELRAANLSYNNIQHLDESLRLLPVLELLDVSHNNITRTDSHLLYLTELRVVNLGYNVIEVIPSFALSSRLLLHTLILRNNNLSHLDGLQDLIGLRELDLANNCLCCHDDLEPLRPLKRLRELVVMGNPLSYEKRHRCLTYSCLHPTALKQIVLDGVAITKKELLSCPKQPSTTSTSGQAFDENSLSALDNTGMGGASGVDPSLDYSYDLATSTADESEVDIVSRVAKHRSAAKRKKQKKPRRAEISDIDSQMEEDTACKASPPTDDGHLHMKEKLEVIRNQLGPSWLQSLDIHQSAANENAEKPPTETDDMVSSRTTETSQTSDSTMQVSRSPGETVDTVTPSQSQPDVFKDTPDGSTAVGETKRDDGRNRSGSTGGDNVVEWKWQNMRGDSVDYGVESEPFIAALVDDASNQFLLTVTDRYVLEKNLDGEVTEVLDLQCLRSLQRLAQGGNEGEECVVRLVFDYVRKDRQERRYLLEDDTDREKFCELLEPVLDDGMASGQMKDKYECMKCGATFSDSQAKHTFHTVAASPARNTMSKMGNAHDGLSCPACGSALIVQLDDHQGAPGWQRTASTPIDRHTSPIGTPTRVSTALNPSPCKSLFIKDPESSVTMATDVSTSYQSCQTGFSCSFQSLPNSPSVRGGGLAHSYPDSFRVPLNNNDSRMKNGAEMRTDAYSMSKASQRTSVTTATAGDAAACCHSHDDSIETIPEHRPSEHFRPRNSVDSGEFVTRHRYVRVNTAESDIVVLGNHHSSQTSCTTEDSDIMILANNPSTVSLGGASDIVVNSSETDSDISVLCPSTVAVVDHDCDTLTSSPRTSASIDIDGPLSQMLHTKVHLGHSSPYSRSHDPSPSSSLTDRAVNSMVSSMYEKSMLESDGGSTCDTTSSDGDTSGRTRAKEKRSGPQRNGGAPCGSPVANGDVFQYSYDDYAQVDHRLKLHLVMKLFTADEEFQLLLRCGIVLPKKSEFPALLVVSSARMYVLRISGKQSTDHPEKWLKMVQQLPLSTLRGVQLGLGCQLVKLDFGNVSLIALLRDDARSQNFTTQFTAILQERVFHGARRPPEVMTENKTELADLTKNVLLYKDGDTDTDDVDTTLIMFVMCHQETTLAGEGRLVPVDLVVTPSHVYLATDSVGCRLVAASDRSSKKCPPPKTQFVFKARQKLLDLTSIDLYKTAATKASLRFVDECSQEETVWCITMETKSSLQSVVSSISQPWEQEFGVELQVNVCVDSGS